MYFTKYKILLLILFSLFIAKLSHAEDNQLVILQKNGNETVLLLASHIVITLSGENMIVTNDNTTIMFPIDNIEGYLFNTGKTSINSLFEAPQYVSGHLLFQGLLPETKVCIYTLDGRLVRKLTADNSGQVDIFLAKYSQGTYLINTPKTKLKVVNK